MWLVVVLSFHQHQEGRRTQIGVSVYRDNRYKKRLLGDVCAKPCIQENVLAGKAGWRNLQLERKGLPPSNPS